MNAVLGTIITGSTLLKLVVGALVAGVGVTVAFSLLIFCVDRASAMRRADQPTMALIFQAASVLALATVFAIIAFGLILTISKPK